MSSKRIGDCYMTITTQYLDCSVNPCSVVTYFWVINYRNFALYTPQAIKLVATDSGMLNVCFTIIGDQTSYSLQYVCKRNAQNVR